MNVIFTHIFYRNFVKLKVSKNEIKREKMRKNEFVVVKLNFTKKVVDNALALWYYIKVAKND